MPASIFRRIFCLAALSLLSLSTFAQTEDQQQEAIKIKTDLVTLDALVTDKKSREIIRNLSTPSQIKDTSWIKPGMMAWDHWWTGDTIMTTDVGSDSLTSAARSDHPGAVADSATAIAAITSGFLLNIDRLPFDPG